MAYTPKTWQCDDTITADELNRMEQGIAEASQGGGGTEPLIVHETERPATIAECESGGTARVLDHTWQEIHDALATGKNAVVVSSLGADMITLAQNIKSAYAVKNSAFMYITDSTDGYPVALDCDDYGTT